MYFTILFLYLLELTTKVLSEANLLIIKKVEYDFIPLPGQRFYSVEEKVGADFSLLCELVFSQKEIGYDGHISWIKKSNKFNTTVDFDQLSSKNLEDFYSSLAPSELNKAEMKFAPLRISDNGSYICFTVKYKKYVTLDLLVRSDERISNERNSVFEPIYCGDSSFRCMFNGVCIFRHYVCDGKKDCKDGSDELCDGDPCKDKLKCEDGRCIPTDWCCDINHDVNCTVTNRPTCCQRLSETFEEYGPPNLTVVQQTNNSAKYLFISVCILSILFSLVLLLLILSKVMIFAKKTALQQRHAPPDIAYYNRGSTRNSRDQSIDICRIPYSFYAYRDGPRTSLRSSDLRNLTVDESDIGDPLLNVPLGNRSDDRPPAYADLVRVAQRAERFMEPPPPYTSREVLNDVTN